MAGLGPAHFAFVERGQGVHPARSRAGWTLASQASTREGVTPGSPEQTGALVWVALGASPLTSSLLRKSQGAVQSPRQREIASLELHGGGRGGRALGTANPRAAVGPAGLPTHGRAGAA